MDAPRLFVSYSWTSPDHESWVLKLATDLRESGIDVILDKWDLKEGHDAHAFMEKMVTDPEIKKVIMVCDQAYVKKADGRSGGVGTEAQIISSEIYAKQAQDKFVSVVVERDEDGKAYLPAYYRSRIYIDMSDPSTSAENFEQLLRWAFDQPLYLKPPLGEKPNFLAEEKRTLTLATSSRHKRAIDSIKNGRDYAIPAVTEYLAILSAELEKLRIDPRVEPFDDAVIESIESFIPYRNEAIELFLTLALYKDTPEAGIPVHRFFENLIPYLHSPQHVNQLKEWDFDNFKFIVHELFLYSVACFVRHERFEAAAYLMGNDFYVRRPSEFGGDAITTFVTFSRSMESLRYRNARLKLKRLSLRADLLQQRCKSVDIEFRHLMQADFVLFLRAVLNDSTSWWPETLLYVGRYAGPFEVFARSRSKAYFNRARVLLGIGDKEQLGKLLQAFATGQRRLPTWDWDSFDPTVLLGYNEIATKP